MLFKVVPYSKHSSIIILFKTVSGINLFSEPAFLSITIVTVSRDLPHRLGLQMHIACRESACPVYLITWIPHKRSYRRRG